LAEALHQYHPDVVGAQPSILLELCRLQVAGKINISPDSIISFAEVLYPRDRETIIKTFGVPVKEVYQCTEGFLGCTCEHGTMHLNEDLVFVEKEFIDKDRFYPIITDFSRSTQFIVRYRLDDVLKLKQGQCPCGSAATAIECIEGRSDDVLCFRKSSGEHIKLFPDVLSRRIAWLCSDFDRYRVVQQSYTRLTISIDCDPERYEMVRGKFADAIEEWLVEQDVEPVSREFVKWTEGLAGSKFRKIQRCFDD
jgi:putative adenylate-forming enzyme